MNDFEKMIQAKPEVAVETIANQLMEIEQLNADNKRLKEAYDHAIDGLSQVIKALNGTDSAFKTTISKLTEQIAECELKLKGGK